MDKDELTPDEIDALSGGAGGRAVEEAESVQAVFRRAAERWAAGLSGLMRVAVEARFAGLRRQSYGRFASGMARTGCCYVLSVASPPGELVLAPSSTILHAMIARLLGGEPCGPVASRRPMTEIEQRLGRRIVAVLIDDLRVAWSDSFDFSAEVVRAESGPSRADVLQAVEPVVVARFELAFSGLSGPVDLCMTSRWMDEMGGRLTAGGASSKNAEQIHLALENSLVELRVELARTRIAAGELLHLGVGDLITTEQPVDRPLVIDVDGQSRFEVRPGTHEGRKAIRIEKRVEGA
ncbi:MAG TPA: FliM/FliN family flagellar motor switch protein [Thermoguttaceae bacterium]|nr:FliM/FliN family flagellar motor switch protein [Thermoguttaceae bacterium]